MRKFISILVFSVFMVLFCGCSPAKYFFLSSDGIITYNRHTGQFEMLWESNVSKQSEMADTAVSVPIPRNVH